MPADLKRRLAREVERPGASLNDVASGILASRYAVSFQPSGRRGAAPRSAGDVLLRMPPELKEKLGQLAGERRRTTNDLIVETLAEALGLKGKEPMASTKRSNGQPPRSEDNVPVASIGA